jgi:gluconolactonase
MALTLRVVDNRFYDFIEVEQDLITLADGLVASEGPVWDDINDRLIFNDIPTSRTLSWSDSEGLKLLFYNGKKSNGQWLDKRGALITCDHYDSRLVRRNTDGSGYTILADEYDGAELNSPNDVVVRSDGLIYFTDPVFGRLDEPPGIPRPFPSDRRPVYMLNEITSELRLVADGFGNPNGLCFSPDEKLLYVNDSAAYCIFVYDVTEEGLLLNQRLFAKTEGEYDLPPDGMKTDEYGNIVCASNDGVNYYLSDGTFLGVVLTPDPALNLTWGGNDRKTLFLTGKQTLQSIKTKVRGK